MTEDRFEAIRIIAGVLFFWFFLALLPAQKKAKSQRKTTAEPQKMKSLKPENPKKKANVPTTTFGDTTDRKKKVPFFGKRNSDIYIDESVDYEVSFDVGGRRKNPPQGFDR